MSSERLIRYITQSNLDGIKQLIEEYNINPNHPGGGYYPLLVAIYQNKTTIVNYLINLPNINLNVYNNKGMGVLHDAVFANNLTTVQLLISRGANINNVDNKARTPLTTAIINGYHNIVDELLKHNATVRLIDIRMAIKHNYPFISFPNLLNRLTYPPTHDDIIRWMHTIVTHDGNDEEYFEYLFERYCTFPEIISDLIGYQDKYHYKLITYAACCSVSTLKILLRNGANPNEIDEDGETPLYIVVENYYNDENPEYLDNIQSLLEYGADPFFKKGERTILEIAKEDNKPKVVGVIENYLNFSDVKGAEEN